MFDLVGPRFGKAHLPSACLAVAGPDRYADVHVPAVARFIAQVYTQDRRAHRVTGRQRVLEQVGAPQVAVVWEQGLAAARNPVDARERKARACAGIRRPVSSRHAVIWLIVSCWLRNKHVVVTFLGDTQAGSCSTTSHIIKKIFGSLPPL